MRRRSVLSVLLVALAGALCVSCSQPPERVLVGIALNSRTHGAVRMAIDEINAAGGIHGVPLEPVGLSWRPERADPEMIVEWANRFADQPGLLAVIGHSDSAATLTSASIYNRRKLVQLVTIATNPAITDIGPWTYRLCISDADQGPTLARYAIRDQGHRRVALLYVNDAYGKGLAHELREEVEKLGGELVASVLHPDSLSPEARDYLRRELERLRRLSPEEAPELFILVQRTDAGLWTIETIRDVGFVDTPLLGADNFSLASFVATHGPSAEGLRAASFYLSPPESERGRAFDAAFRDREGRPPDYGDAYAYDAVYLFRDAVANGGFSRAGVKEHLDELIASRREIDSVAESFVLGPDHDARRSFYIVELRGDRFVPVETVSNR